MRLIKGIWLFKFLQWERLELDIINEEKVNNIMSTIKPEVIVHCAAFTHVDKAELEPDTAFLINAMGTRNIAIAAERYQIKAHLYKYRLCI